VSKEKKSELKEAITEFSNLMAKSNLLSCTTIQKTYGRGRNREERVIHDPRCEKCGLRRQAQSLRIACHEWPLPASESAAKSVVFELDIPRLIRGWRSTTYRILVDILNPTPPTQARLKSVVLTEYEGLARHLRSSADRLQLASSTKPFAQTQHGSQTVSEATEDSVCLPNNLNFAMQDAKSQRGTSEYLNKCDIQQRCTLKLPPGPYETLQYAVNDTKHTSNEIISKQGSCPDGLTVHEVYAFVALRSGHRLQVPPSLSMLLLFSFVSFFFSGKEKSRSLSCLNASQVQKCLINKTRSWAFDVLQFIAHLNMVAWSEF
jgi:hypothetical protein